MSNLSYIYKCLYIYDNWFFQKYKKSSKIELMFEVQLLSQLIIRLVNDLDNTVN